MTSRLDLNDPTAFESVQEAIDSAKNFDIVVAHPGTYAEASNFKARAITVESLDPNDPNMVAATILDGAGQTVVAFQHGEGENSVLLGFTLRNGSSGSRRPLAGTLSERTSRGGGPVPSPVSLIRDHS